MINREDINFTRIETFRYVIDAWNEYIPKHVVTRMEIDFLLFETLQCKMDINDRLNSFDEVKDRIIELFINKIPRA